jgi:hypothetical protein
MADTSANALRAIMTALEVIVAPTVDPSDPIAQEQLQSAVRYLQFLESRLDFIYDRERFELSHHLKMADSMMARAEYFPVTSECLAQSVDEARISLGRLGEDVPSMRDQTAILVSAIRLVIEEVADAPSHVRDVVERIILDVSEERIQLDRSWYFPLGFEHSPDDVVPLLRVLHPAG